MKRIAIALSALLLVQGSGWAASIEDRLKANLRGLLVQDKAEPAFLFEDFRQAKGSTDRSLVWTVGLTVEQAIAADLYAVKTAFIDQTGRVLFQGAEIVLPAAAAGKTLTLTRTYQGQPALASLRFEVFDRVAGKVLQTQTYPIGELGMRTESATLAGGLPRERAVVTGGELKYTLRPYLAEAAFGLRNDSPFPLRIERVSAVYRQPGLAGLDAPACAQAVLQPGQETRCPLARARLACAGLTDIELDLQLNGVRFFERLMASSTVREIGREPVVRLERRKHDNVVGNGSGFASVSVPGVYLPIGGRAVIKALASLDSDRFPVMFYGEQKDDQLFGQIEVVGTRYNQAPDQFCFHLQEIVTDDSLACGGVGILLYRNWEQKPKDMMPLNMPGNYFLYNKYCR